MKAARFDTERGPIFICAAGRLDAGPCSSTDLEAVHLMKAATKRGTTRSPRRLEPALRREANPAVREAARAVMEAMSGFLLAVATCPVLGTEQAAWITALRCLRGEGHRSPHRGLHL